jgi:ribosomal protein S18 acetylase RimI-like enzyme
MTPKELTPRPATAADAARLTALARAAYAVFLPITGVEPIPMAADWASVLTDHEIWILDGPPDGAADGPMASLALQARPDHVLIWSVAVAPEHQHRGIGRFLMAFAERRTRELGRGELRLYTNARMERNIALYRRLGYVVTRQEELADRTVTHMSKQIGERR